MASVVFQQIEFTDSTSLALSLGYTLDGPEFDWFITNLYRLGDKRLLFRRCLGTSTVRKKSDDMEFDWEWGVLPFTRELLRDQLRSGYQTRDCSKLCLKSVQERCDIVLEQGFDLEQTSAYRWECFLEQYAETDPQRIGNQFERIYYFFLRCVEKGEWDRVFKIGRRLSSVLSHLGFQQTQPKQKSLLVNICEDFIKAAKQLENSDKYRVEEALIQVAMIYSEFQDSQMKDQALEYAKEASKKLKVVPQFNDQSLKKDLHYLTVKLHLSRKELGLAQQLLDESFGGRALDAKSERLAHQLAMLLYVEHPDAAKGWLDKIIDSGKDSELLVRARTDLADIYLAEAMQEDDIKQRSWLFKEPKKHTQWIRENARLFSLTDENCKSLIRFETIDAQIAYFSKDFEKSKERFKNAIKYARHIKDRDVEEKLTEMLFYITYCAKKFDPIGEIDALWGIKFQDVKRAKPEQDSRCGICQRDLDSQNVSQGSILTCPKCGASFHANCLADYDNMCRMCQTVIVLSAS